MCERIEDCEGLFVYVVDWMVSVCFVFGGKKSPGGRGGGRRKLRYSQFKEEDSLGMEWCPAHPQSPPKSKKI